MPRPKKKKVEVINGLRPGSLDTSTGATAVEEASASTVDENIKEPHVDSLKAEEKELRLWAKGETAKQRKLVQEYKVHVRKAEAALRHEQRLAEERERRWWAAERHAEPPPAYLQLERVYKSKVKDLQARLALSEAHRAVSVAETGLQKCLNLELEVKHAHELSKLCE